MTKFEKEFREYAKWFESLYKDVRIEEMKK